MVSSIRFPFPLVSRYDVLTQSNMSPVDEANPPLLRTGTFYTVVTSQEMRAVYDAMSREFTGTGHWYYCGNGHAFTIGECGMPMQTSLCPQCGAQVGGQSHRAVDGVRRADDIESAFGRMRI